MAHDKEEQLNRFIETARELGCDEDPATFDAAFDKIVPPKTGGEKPKVAKLRAPRIAK